MTSSYHASVPRLRTGLSVQQPSGSWSQTYGYDAARRLQTVGGPAGTFTYTYKGPGTVWTNLVVPTSPTAAITNAYDSGGRLTGTWLRNNAGTILNQHTYLYNGGGQRQRQTITDNSYTTYGYDDDAQLTVSVKRAASVGGLAKLIRSCRKSASVNTVAECGTALSRRRRAQPCEGTVGFQWAGRSSAIWVMFIPGRRRNTSVRYS